MQGKVKILVVEDEPNLALGILDNLELEGYGASWAQGGQEALRLLREEPQDLIVLDVMLPELDGIGVCQAIRARGDGTPILFLSAKNSPHERVLGLEAGGDDYLGKPFHVQELLARIRNLLRRKGAFFGPGGVVDRREEQPFVLGLVHVYLTPGKIIDADGYEAWLKPREAQFLRLLAGAQNAVVTREELIEGIFSEEVLPASSVLEPLAQALRLRIEQDPEHPVFLETISGVGFRLVTKDPD